MHDDDTQDDDLELAAPEPMDLGGDADVVPGEAPSPELLPHGDRLTGAAGGPPAEQAFVRGGAVGETRAFAFYDRLRGKVIATVERRGGRLGRAAGDALLLVPDVFMLLVRLALDPQVPAATRSLIGGALAYFVLPIDLLPEGLVGGVGFLDDLVLATAVLTQAMSPALEAKARRYWSGRHELRQVLRDVIGAAESLLGANLYGRLQSLLARRGVAMPEPPAASERDDEPQFVG